uniref:Uncharacterized protein n=1 Tax=Panagrolaimus sp. ES5 TaxID=591445 RepID=A0AC34FWH4_9BILA
MSESNEDTVKSVPISTIVVENGISPSAASSGGGGDNDGGGESSSSRPRRTQFSHRSQPLIDEANRLLSLKPTGTPTIKMDSLDVDSDYPDYKSHTLNRSLTSSSVRPSNPYKLHLSPSIGSRVDFEDVITESISNRKPAWKELRESIKDSYYKPKRLSEQQEEIREFQSSLLDRRTHSRRSTSPFAYLPRQTSYSSYERGPYAAPAVSSSQGIESSTTESRYERLANDVEARLLKTTYGLSSPRYRSISTKEFRRAPEPASGSMTETYLDEAESLVMPRPYYSRPNRRDPDYFDFDLQHSVSLFKKPEGRYVPRGPSSYDSKLLGDYKTKGEAPLSGHMFTQGESDYRTTGTSLLSAALRTPSFWEHRFSSIGNQVRESNPVSFASIERNRPVPNRFTEYRDPELESLDDDLSD